jgi:adenylate cyclase
VVRNVFDKAVYHQQRALALNPNDDLIVVQQGEIMTWLGQGEEGIEWIRKAMRLNPYHPERFWFHLARAQFVAKRYADASSR